QPEVLPAAERLEGFRGEGRGDDRLHEKIAKLRHEGGIRLAVEADDAPEGGLGVRLEGPLESLRAGSSDAGAAGGSMLDDGAGRRGELAGEAEGRVEVLDVVERQLLAVDLLGRCDAGSRRLRVPVEGRALVWVLAVAEILRLEEIEREPRREM